MSKRSSNRRIITNPNGNTYYCLDGDNFSVRVREAKTQDADHIVSLKSKTFSAHNYGNYEWLFSNWNTSEQKCSRCYVITYDKEDGRESPVIGYIFWRVRAGFDIRLTIELDQLAVDEAYYRQGFASSLIRQSIIQFEQFLQMNFKSLKPRIGIVFVTTGLYNPAQELYKKTLGVQIKGNVGGLYGPGDGVIMLVNERIEDFLPQQSMLENNIQNKTYAVDDT